MSDLQIHVTPDGHRRPLGNLPRIDGPPPVCRRLALPDIPESEWREFDLRDEGLPIEIKDQNGYGACNGFAAATALEAARWIAGLGHVPLSAWYVYAILCNGVDRGSFISDALTLCRDRGVPTEGRVKYGTINPRNLTREAHEEAGRFKIEVGAPLRNFREMMWATQLRQPFNYSINVGANFDRLDADGVVGYSRGPGNHAVAGGFGAKKSRRGEWAILWPNSWSTRWGLDGWAWVTARHIDEQPYFDAYTIEAATDDPLDPANPRR